MIDKIKVDNKYTIEMGEENGEMVSRILRYNEPWIDKIYMTDGGNCIMSMAYEIMKLRDRLNKIEEIYDIDEELLK